MTSRPGNYSYIWSVCCCHWSVLRELDAMFLDGAHLFRWQSLTQPTCESMLHVPQHTVCLLSLSIDFTLRWHYTHENSLASMAKFVYYIWSAHLPVCFCYNRKNTIKGGRNFTLWQSLTLHHLLFSHIKAPCHALLLMYYNQQNIFTYNMYFL